MSRPLVLATYSNSGKNNLGYLNLEMKQIWSSFLASQISGRVTYTAPPFDVTTGDLKELIGPVKHLSIFHYSGHADPNNLWIQEEGFAASQLYKLLESITVDVVILNGCSTEGFVDTLLQKGVKAVIATERSVRDLDATQFASTLYKSLLSGDKLQAAFNSAVFDFNEDKNPYIQRGNLRIKNPHAQCAWGIYYEKDNLEKAKLAEEYRLIDPEEQVPSLPFSADVEKEITQLQRNINRLERGIEEFKQNGSSYLLDDLLEDLKLNFDSTDPAATVLTLYRRIDELLTKQYEPIVEAMLLSKFNAFNYVDQRDAYYPLVTEQINCVPKTCITSAYLLQGSSKCGLGFLQRHIQDLYELPIGKEQVELIEVLLDSRSMDTLQSDTDKLWQALGRKIGKPQASPDDIAAYISIKQRNMPVILVFSGGELPETNLAILNDFWLDFKRRLKPCSSHVVLLFVRAIFKGGIPKNHPYGQQINIGNDAYVIPIVKRVNAAIVDRWRQEARIAYTYNETDFQNEPFVMDALKDICKKLSERDQKYWTLYEKRLATYYSIS